MADLAPYYSAFRSVAIFGSGIAATFGLTSVGQSGDVVGGVDHIIAGSKEIAAGIGILAPIALGAWGIITHGKTAVLAAAAEIPGDEKLQAFRDIPDAAMLKVVHALPDVAKIVVKPTASSDIKNLVADRGYPKVVAAP
jgi:hypothetical protein